MSRRGPQDDAFCRALVQAREPLLKHALRKMQSRPDAEDLVQTTMVRALGARERFDESSSLLPWLYRIQGRLFIDELRRTRRTAPFEDVERLLPAVRMELAEERTPDETFSSADIRRAADETLREPFRTTFRMFHFEGASIREIADSTRTLTSTVGVRLHRARKSLAPVLLPHLICKVQEARVRAPVW